MSLARVHQGTLICFDSDCRFSLRLKGTSLILSFKSSQSHDMLFPEPGTFLQTTFKIKSIPLSSPMFLPETAYCSRTCFVLNAALSYSSRQESSIFMVLAEKITMAAKITIPCLFCSWLRHSP